MPPAYDHVERRIFFRSRYPDPSIRCIAAAHGETRPRKSTSRQGSGDDNGKSSRSYPAHHRQNRRHSSLKSSGTLPNLFSTTASENSPTFGSPARLNAIAPALAGSLDIPSARLIAAASLWHSAIAAAAAQRRDCATARSENRTGDPATASLQRRHSNRGDGFVRPRWRRHGQLPLNHPFCVSRARGGEFYFDRIGWRRRRGVGPIG